MSTAAVVRARYPRAVANGDRYGGGAGRGLNKAGHLIRFSIASSWSIGWALRRYRRETVRLIAQIGMGTGAMAVVGGTAAIVGFVTLSGGSLIAIQGFASLGNIGVEAFTGFFAALANVRVVAAVVSGVALAATVGAGATARARRDADQRGDRRAGRDGHQVDGIPGVHPDRRRDGGDRSALRDGDNDVLPVGAGRYDVVLRTVIGTYEHYFRTFLRTDDVFGRWSRSVFIAAAVMLTHCYYGYTASGGPVGVGYAVGKSMRFSLVSIQVVVLMFIVRALRCRPELQPHGVAGMASP